MTVVAALDFFSELMVVADTRVSHILSHDPARIQRTDDCLIKLYGIRSPQSPGKCAILGFSCLALRAARAVLLHLGRRKLWSYGRPLVMASLKDEVRRWIEESTVTLEPETRGQLRFLLCGIEPSRGPRAYGPTGEWGRVQIGGLPMVEGHIYVYSVKQDTGAVRVARCKDMCAVIGPRRELCQQIQDQVHHQLIGFGAPVGLHQERARAAAYLVDTIFAGDEQSRGVGGPFHVVRINAEGVSQFYHWPSALGTTRVEVAAYNDKTVVYSPEQRKSYTLHPVWGDLPFRL